MMQEFQSKHQELVSGLVERIDPRTGAISLRLGKAEAVLPKNEQIGGENVKEGDYIKVYVVDVRETEKGPKAIISRTHPDLVKRMFETEVPEIYDARWRSSRFPGGGLPHQAGRDEQRPGGGRRGRCIGARGSRVSEIVDELGGEKIDIVEYSDEPEKFIAAALSPANVLSVETAADGSRSCKVTVPDNQLSLAIGNKGQNARLAAKLTAGRLTSSRKAVFTARKNKAWLVPRAARPRAESRAGACRKRPARACGRGRPTGDFSASQAVAAACRRDWRREAMRPKKTPLRMCAGCGEMKPKKELARVVRAPRRRTKAAAPCRRKSAWTWTGKKPGRGAYLCLDAQCLKQARKSRRLERAFSCKIPEEVYDRMEEEIQRAQQAQEEAAQAASVPRDEKGRPIIVIEEPEEALPRGEGAQRVDKLLSLLGLARRAGKIEPGSTRRPPPPKAGKRPCCWLPGTFQRKR